MFRGNNIKKYIACITVFILLYTTILPISTISEPISEVTKLNDNYIKPPSPGYMPESFDEFNKIENVQNTIYRPNLHFPSINGTIIEIIQQLNDQLIQGYLENITSFGPHATGTTECELVGNYLFNEFQGMGLDVRYHNWSYSGYDSSNIEATLDDTDGTGDEIVVICAHYDSVSSSPGADDDGSGVAAVLAAANIMRHYDFNHTIRFVAFSGEEQGLLGSHEYVEEAFGNGDNIVAALNADMIGYAITQDDGNKIKVFHEEFDWLTNYTDVISDVYYDYIELEVVPYGYSTRSDHYSFWQFGYQAIFYHEYKFNEYYHSEDDTIENMNVSYNTKSSKLIIATLAELARTYVNSRPPETPTIAGPSNGTADTQYEYSFSTIDPDGEDLYYFIDWGDNKTSGWIGPFPSGESVNTTHAWSKIGDYEIKVKAADIYQTESNWSVPITISIKDESDPRINILRPTEALYFRNMVIIPLSIAVVIGTIDVRVDVSDSQSGIEKAELYINDELKATFNNTIYTWTWDERSFSKNTIKVIAFDNSGNNKEKEMSVWKFF